MVERYDMIKQFYHILISHFDASIEKNKFDLLLILSRCHFDILTLNYSWVTDLIGNVKPIMLATLFRT